MKINDGTLFAGLYGSFQPHAGLDPDADAYSLFVSRATAMRWLSFNATTATTTYTRHGLWAMNDAGQDWTGQTSRIAWYQVGIHEGQPLPIQPLLTCAGDSLTRAGTINLHAVQLLLPVHLAADTGPDLASASGQFPPADPGTTRPVTVTLDSGESQEIPDRADEILASLTTTTRNGFAIHETHIIDANALPTLTGRLLGSGPPVVDEFWLGDGHHAITVHATLPEWTLDAIGWITEAITEACRRNGVQTSVLATVARG